MNNIITKTPLMDLSDNKDLEKSVLDIFSDDSSKLAFKHYGFSYNPFVRPDNWPDSSEYKKSFGSDLFIQNIFEKEFLKDFVNAVSDNKYFLIRGPSGIGKSTISELFYSLLATSENFASNIKTQLGIKKYFVLKLNFETENWKYEIKERLDRTKNQLDEIKPAEKFDATFLIIDNIAEISDCWTEITDLFNEFFGYFFIVGTIKISEYLFLDYFRKKSYNEKANTVDRFIEAFSIVKDIPLWPVSKIQELLEKRVNLSANRETFNFDPEVFKEISKLSSGIPQIGLGLLDKLFSSAFEHDKINNFTLKVTENLLTKDHLDKLREYNLISRASEPGAEIPLSIKKLYNDLTKDTRKGIITNLVSAYGGVKLRIGKYPSLNIDNHLKNIAKNAIKDLPMIPSRLSEEVAKGASTITYHLDWLENQGLVTRTMQDEKEKIVLLKESSVELFEILSTSFCRA